MALDFLRRQSRRQMTARELLQRGGSRGLPARPNLVKEAFKIISGGSRAYQGVTPFVVPVSIAGTPSGGAGLFRQGFTASKNLLRSVTTNPLAGLGFKEGLKKGAILSASGIAGIEGTRAFYAAASGDPYKPASLRTLGLIAAASPFTPLPLKLFGAAAGFGKAGFTKAKETITETLPRELPAPFLPKLPDFILEQGDTIFNFPEPSTIGGFSSAPLGAFAPSVNVGGSIQSGGGLDFATLDLLVMGTGVGGYAPGRR